MRRLLPQSLAGQTVLVLVVGLTFSHILSTAFYVDDRAEALTLASGRHMARHAANIANLLDTTPRAWRTRIVATLNTNDLRVALSPESELIARQQSGRWTTDIEAELTRQLRGATARPHVVQFLDAAADRPPLARLIAVDWVPPALRALILGPVYRQPLRISIQLADGQWINFANSLPPWVQGWSSLALVSALSMALAVLFLSLWVVHRLTAPLGVFVRAAERLGKDVGAPPLAVRGPLEVRRATQAFNEMQERLQRFVADRTRMLAAISHDLRTPITLLRLRAELIDEESERDRMLATLDGMETMIASTLAFAREDAESEARRRVDIGALLESICDDMTDTGLPVHLETTAKLLYDCRPTALRRALTNLIENAVKYGGQADVRLTGTRRALTVTIADRGPGIAMAERQRVFDPFYRIEPSRNPETGGIGLGLSVAKTVIHAHGGEIRLADRDGGGLVVDIVLPR